MKNYLADIVDLTGNAVLNPSWPQNKRPVNWIEKFVVHHDAQNRPHDYPSVPRYEQQAKYQNTNSIPGSRGLQYHYRIDNIGGIFKVRPHEIYLWHCGDFAVNQRSIAICLDGNFENQQPTREQLEALTQLLTKLSTKHPEFPAAQNDTFPHRQFTGTSCPGNNLAGFVNHFRERNGDVFMPDVPYDWPSLQPGAPAPVPTPPAPAPIPEQPQPVTPAPEPVPEAPKPPQPTPEPSDELPGVLRALRALIELVVKLLGRIK